MAHGCSRKLNLEQFDPFLTRGETNVKILVICFSKICRRPLPTRPRPRRRRSSSRSTLLSASPLRTLAVDAVDEVELVDAVRDEDVEELVVEPLADPAKPPLPSPTHRLSLPSPKSSDNPTSTLNLQSKNFSTLFRLLSLPYFVPSIPSVLSSFDCSKSIKSLLRPVKAPSSPSHPLILFHFPSLLS